MSEVVRVAQLSDTHFLEPGLDPEGGHGYDTLAAFDAVLEHVRAHDQLDLIVVTGDVADHGRPEQYEMAASAFGRLPAPVVVCPGNHDFDDPFRAGFAEYGIEVPLRTDHGAWSFVYADSNAGAMLPTDEGRLVDPPGEARLHRNGSLGEHESQRLRMAIDPPDVDHVFVWLHHPPAADVPISFDAEYAAEWSEVIESGPRVRGFGAGHTHVPSAYRFAGRQVFVSPSLKNNFDLDANTWLPPGYRTYEFHANGKITSDVHFVDDERWPRRPFGRALRSLFMGDITYEQLAEIVARRSSAAS